MTVFDYLRIVADHIGFLVFWSSLDGLLIVPDHHLLVFWSFDGFWSSFDFYSCWMASHHVVCSLAF